MWEWISSGLGWVSSIPWIRPIVSLISGVIAALITYWISDVWWALSVLLLSLTVALVSFAESFRGPVAALGFTIFAISSPPAWAVAMSIFDRLPGSCYLHQREGETPDECFHRKMNEAVERYAPG